jgi:hypothetical protein
LALWASAWKLVTKWCPRIWALFTNLGWWLPNCSGFLQHPHVSDQEGERTLASHRWAVNRSLAYAEKRREMYFIFL